MKIGIIGGSGLYRMDGLERVGETRLETPFGDPSDAFITGTLHDREVVFLPRHGVGHRLIPSEIPFRANVWGMKQLGVTHLISVSAVGSLKAEIEPGHIVFPDQFIDRTSLRASTFFGNGAVAHVQFGDPVCPQLVSQLAAAAVREGIDHHRGGTYVCMEGPAFSTRAESMMYRAWGGAVIGMTNLTEAKLAREAEMCFATIALATDYDCWHESEDQVTVEAILKVMEANIAKSRRLLGEIAATMDLERPCACREALRDGLLTPAENIPERTRNDLKPLLARYLNG
ncbi:MAG: S-methyl-5'-thioadenosine phosphorylase [SAR324 cluster bacterium]|nr:S-methyl-5'-thioadenosine phosphorylase [SAR324 cluster bacterium]MCH8886677.1 S-methyl-5'-thioadenosine phosphorylase [SAR324 cluster bacterium]